MKKRIAMNLKALKMHPAKAQYGNSNEYHIKWTYLLGQIFHPLCLKYNDRILQDTAFEFFND